MTCGVALECRITGCGGGASYNVRIICKNNEEKKRFSRVDTRTKENIVFVTTRGLRTFASCTQK